MAEGPSSSEARRGFLVPRDLRTGRRVGGLLVLVGVAIAIAGLATFTPPTCTSPSPSQPARCTAWENAQWLMIGGALVGVVGFLYLAHLLQVERRQAAREETATELAS